MESSSLLKAQVARDLLKRDFLDRLDGLDASVRKLEIGAVESRTAAGDIFPGVVQVGGQPKIVGDGAGNIYIGSNAGEAAGTHFSVFANDGTYNGEAVGAGDLLIGDNSASKANILWDKSAGQLKFRGGTTTQLYIDTDGTMVAGAGNVELNSGGLSLYAASAYGTASSRLNVNKASAFGGGILGYLEGYFTMNGISAAYLRLYLAENPALGTNPKVELVSDENLADTYVGLSADVVSVSNDLSIVGSITSSTAVGCRARRTAATSSLTWGSWYYLTPQSESGLGCFDNDAMWQSGWNYLLINTAGIYVLGGMWTQGNGNSTGMRLVELFLDTVKVGTYYAKGDAGYDNHFINCVAKCDAGDKFYFKYKYQGGSGTATMGHESSMLAVTIA
jgi:hypothetical protein